MNPCFSLRAAVILFFLTWLPFVSRAKWDAPGVTHVPICGSGALSTQGTWFNIEAALDEPLSPEDLAQLRGKPGFTGLTDAQIQEKILKLRREVFEAIQLIAQTNVNIGIHLEDLFLTRRIFIEFSNRQIAGTVDGDALGKLAPDCSNASIAIKIFPSDRVPDWDANFVAMTAALLHEGSHLEQDWPPGFIKIKDIKVGQWRDQMDTRVKYQDNEIETSRIERAVSNGLWQAFNNIRTTGKVPPDDPGAGIYIPPVAREIADRFLKETPVDEQKAKAGVIAQKLEPVFGMADMVIKCRTQFRNKAAEMRDRPVQPTDFVTLNVVQQEWLKFTAGTGWFTSFGTDVDEGVFSLSMLAGGGGVDANTVRQYNTTAGTLSTVTVPGLSAITDVDFVSNRTILIGGVSTTPNQGALYALTDTNADNYFDASSLTLVQSSNNLNGGVSVVCDREGGRAFCYGRLNGNLYALTPVPPAVPTTLTLRGTTNGSLILEDNFYLALPAGSPSLYFLPEYRGFISGSTQWSSAPATGMITNEIRRVRPLDLVKVPPVFIDTPYIGEKYVRFGGVPDTEISLYNDAPATPALLGKVKTDFSGGGLFYVPALTANLKLRLTDPLTGSSYQYQPGPPPIPNKGARLPRNFWWGSDEPLKAPTFNALPHTSYTMDFSEHATWSTSNSAIGTVNGRGITTASPAIPLVNGRPPATGFWRCRFAQRDDIVPECRVFVVPPGITQSIDLHVGEFDFDSADGRSSATYTILDRGGLHEKACHMSADNKKLECTQLLTHDSSTSPVNIKMRRVDIVSNETQDFFISMYSNRRALVPTNVGPLQTVDIPCLIINNVPYPIYQFFLMNTETDLCTEPHWHSGGVAYSLFTPTVATNEPAINCGWGLLEAVEFDYVLVNTVDWLNFVTAHPPPVSIYN